MAGQPTCIPNTTSLGISTNVGFQGFSLPSTITSTSVSTQPSFGTSFSFGITKNLQQPPSSQPSLVSKDAPASTTVPGTVSVTPGIGTGFQVTTAPSSQASLFALPTSSNSLSAAAPKLSFGSTFGTATSSANQAVSSASTVISQPSVTSLSTTISPFAAIPSTTSGPLTSVSTSAPSIPTNADSTTAKGSAMTYNQLEELINKWSHELEEQERYFLEEADRIVQWDQALILNSEKITTLYEKVDACKTEQTQLEQELDFIESQQRELDALLEPLEKAANDLPPGQLHSDFEREAIFQLAANVDLELDQLLSDLRDMADQVNAFTSRSIGDMPASKDSDDLKDQTNAAVLAQSVSHTGPGAVQQVTRILNCHMHSLNWIHQNTQDLIERVKLLEGS